jgi:hypothetical protein
MSEERELLRKILKANDEGYLSFLGFASLKNEIQELLAQPEQEPVAWLITATSCGGAQDWKFVSLERKAPERLERMFPVFTPLYTSPPTHLISAAPELLEALSNWINALDDPSEWMKCRNDAKRAIAKAHGIGGGE